MDAIGARVRDPQELHLYPGAFDGGGDAEGGKGAEGVGVGYREEETEGC